MRIYKNKFFITATIFLLSLTYLNAAKPQMKPFKALEPSKSLPAYGVRAPLEALKLSTGVDARADSFEYVGDNLIAKGNVFVRKGEVTIHSDMAIVNTTNKNIELSGNVKFYSLYRTRLELEYWELEQLQSLPNTKVKVVGTVMTVSGRQKLVADLVRKEMSWSGERAAGSLKTGFFEFGNFVSRFGNWYLLGARGRRDPDGEVVLKNATVTPCEAITEGHSVLTVESSKVVAVPPSGSSYPGDNAAHLKETGRDFNNYHFWAYNNVFYVGGIPVFWLPIFYKPPRGEEGFWDVKVGSTADWGVYVQTTNLWRVVDTPDVSLRINNMLDWYDKRGFGYGNQTVLNTKHTQSELLAYGIYDNNVNMRIPDFSRFALPDHMFRYGVQFKNITNLTDRLSFRGNFSKFSDLYFLYDYFYDLARINPQPATFGSLDYQFDNFSVNLSARPRTNLFYSVVQQLPKLDISIPRQELFKNLFYQGQTTLGYYNMAWRHFKVSRSQAGLGNDGPSDYGSFRLDSLHFGYYPIKLDWLNIIPRAGVRMTAYSNSSSTPVSATELNKLIAADAPEGRFSGPITNYDNFGGGRVRVLSEFGVEVNTKISRTWNNVKNSYFDFNGFRHVMKPYANYTYLMNPTENRDYLYYFDDIDRVTHQNFFRIGLENRFQTRRGEWNSSQVYTWATIENYMDFVLHKRDGVTGGGSFLGDIGMKGTLQPTENLRFEGEILLDPSQFVSTFKTLSPISKASISTAWQFAENWSLSGTYFYGNGRFYPGAYSMGSTLTELQSGSTFLRSFTNSSYVNLKLDGQINERTAAYILFEYDFLQNLMPNLEFGVVRALPCGLEGVLSIGFSRRNRTNGTGSYFPAPTVSGSVGFSSSGDYTVTPRKSLLPESIRRTTLP